MRYVYLIATTICAFIIVASCIVSCFDADIQIVLFPYFMGAMWVGMFTMISYIDTVAEDTARATLAHPATV